MNMKIQVCTWKMCKSRFSEYITKRLNADVEKFNLKNVILETCSCLWECKSWPNVLFDWKIEKYVDPVKASKIMFEKMKSKN